MTRTPLTATDLAPLARAALGRTPLTATRLPGGTRKGVYRLALDDSSTAVAYVWSAAEDFWDAAPPGPRDPLTPGTGLALFTAAHDRLTAAGVRTPRLLYADATRTLLPADAAVVEDLTGGSLQEALAGDPREAEAALARFADLVARLHAQRGPAFGSVALVDNGAVPKGGSCERLVTEGALRDIAASAARDRRIAAARDELDDVVEELASAVRPRSRFSLVHGELGPDHVLLTAQGQPALIDVEGLRYFDVEWEHVFLRLRLGSHYPRLRTAGLDEDRLRLYRLATHLSLVAGPLRLLEGDFPDRVALRGIVEHHLRRALEFVGG
ncbi:phosphotransferase [Streptomyces griseoviridis]